MYIAVCGPDPASPEVTSDAEAVGRLLGEAGAVVVCGGHGGAMAAVAAGARSAGGLVVGLLPGLDRTGGDPNLTVAIPTGMGELRNGLIVRAADAVIAVGGEFGTLSEIAFALKTGVPVVGLGTWELTKAGNAIDPDPILRATTAEEAVAIALRVAGRSAPGST
jgi:uncharacterized protein (TIGR00725 family)